LGAFKKESCAASSRTSLLHVRERKENVIENSEGGGGEGEGVKTEQNTSLLKRKVVASIRHRKGNKKG
jgi:hypothetical protein